MKKKIPSILLISAGLFLLLMVGIPIISSQLKFLSKPQLLDPTNVSRMPVLAATTSFAPEADYTHSDTWFNAPPPLTPTLSKVNYYNISIPSVGIKEVTVEINGIDLSKNAIQYPGTAEPGTFGNTVIFGHSTLPQLSKPGDPLSVFTTLPKVKKGDEVIINYDGVTYRYVIKHTAEVEPNQIDVLAQQYDKNEITIVTCVPLGTYLHRFVARAELVN